MSRPIPLRQLLYRDRVGGVTHVDVEITSDVRKYVVKTHTLEVNCGVAALTPHQLKMHSNVRRVVFQPRNLNHPIGTAHELDAHPLDCMKHKVFLAAVECGTVGRLVVRNDILGSATIEVLKKRPKAEEIASLIEVPDSKGATESFDPDETPQLSFEKFDYTDDTGKAAKVTVTVDGESGRSVALEMPCGPKADGTHGVIILPGDFDPQNPEGVDTITMQPHLGNGSDLGGLASAEMPNSKSAWGDSYQVGEEVINWILPVIGSGDTIPGPE